MLYYTPPGRYNRVMKAKVYIPICSSLVFLAMRVADPSLSLTAHDHMMISSNLIGRTILQPFTTIFIIFLLIAKQ